MAFDVYGIKYAERDAVRGDTTLFLHRDEIELAWKWADGILDHWATGDAPLHKYARNSFGPEVAERLVLSDGNWDNDLIEPTT